MRLLFKNAQIFDGEERLEGQDCVIVEDERIVEIGASEQGSFDRVIDCAGRTLIPGLIDAHVHVYAFNANLSLNDAASGVARTLHAESMMKQSLGFGFTSLRDAGGADRDLHDALTNKMFVGPRLFFSGKALSQTGGHGDLRVPGVRICGCGYTGATSALADGEDEVRKAAREQLRTGAAQIKIMASGGAASPSDPIWMLQYTDAEISAAVQEAERWGTYVMAHAYTADAIIRCAKLGVRSVEHANLIDETAAVALAELGTFVVPTLATYDALLRRAPDLGWGVELMDKVELVAAAGRRSLAICRDAGVKMGLGTDLLGPMQIHQRDEFRIRAEVLQPIEILRSATSINAELMMRKGEIGTIAVGAFADIVLVDGDPLADISIMAGGDKVALVMKNGDVVRSNIP